MADLTAENYQDALAATKPGSGASDEDRAFALQIIQEFEDQHAAKQGAPAAAPAAAQSNLAGQLDPRFSLLPQALAVQPTTTDPAGDDAAKDKWLVDGGKNAKGTVIYYEPPLSVAKKDLLENPAIGRMLYPDDPGILDPQEIANLKASDPLFDDYKNHKWNETAKAAAAAGKTVYRYSKAPYLQGDGAASTLNTLGLKAINSAEPALSAIQSFLGGIDKAGYFGIGNRVGGAVSGLPGAPPSAAGGASDPFLESLKGSPDEPTKSFVGGTSNAANFKDYAALSAEEHPVVGALGQGLGMLHHWTPTNQLFQAATNTAARGAAAVGGGVLARLGASTLGAGAAGALDQGIREGVNAAGDLAEHGETPITMGGALGNMEDAALLTGGIGGGLEGAGALSKAGADAIANGSHFRGVPGRLERAGVKFTVGIPPFGGPQLSPETKAVVNAARMTDKLPGDFIAKQIAPDIAKAADEEVKGAIQKVTDRKQVFYKTREGQMRLPAAEVVKRELGLLDSAHSEVDGQLRPIGDKQSQVSFLHRNFNNDIGGVSLDPVPGAIPLDPKKADAYLSDYWKGKLLEQRPVKAPPGGPGSPFEPAADLAASPGTVLGQPQGVGTTPQMPEAQGIGPSHVVNDAVQPRFGTGFLSPTADGKVVPQRPIAVTDQPRVESRFLRRPGADVSSVKQLVARTDAMADSLTPDELDAVRSYTSGRSEKVGTPAWKSAVEKLTVENPTDAGTLYHGTRMSSEQLDGVLKSGKYATDRPLSLSFNGDLSDAFAQGREARGQKVLLEFPQLNEAQSFLGKKLGIGRSGLEREINLANPAQFSVVGHSVDAEGTTHIQLDQVGAGGRRALPADRAAHMRPSSNEPEPTLGEGKTQPSEGELERALVRRGVQKVYVVPRRFNAEEQQGHIDSYQELGDPSDPDARERKEIYLAALKDRDARPGADGPGGWSAMQAEHSALIGDAKDLEKLVSPQGEPFKVLARYGKQRTGGLLSDEALQRAAQKSGVSEQLNAIRILDPLERLKNATTYGPPMGGGARLGPAILNPMAHADAAAIRAFPVLRALGGPATAFGPLNPMGPTGAIRRGMGGVLGIGHQDDQETR